MIDRCGRIETDAMTIDGWMNKGATSNRIHIHRWDSLHVIDTLSSSNSKESYEGCDVGMYTSHFSLSYQPDLKGDGPRGASTVPAGQVLLKLLGWPVTSFIDPQSWVQYKNRTSALDSRPKRLLYLSKI